MCQIIKNKLEKYKPIKFIVFLSIFISLMACGGDNGGDSPIDLEDDIIPQQSEPFEAIDSLTLMSSDCFYGSDTFDSEVNFSNPSAKVSSQKYVVYSNEFGGFTVRKLRINDELDWVYEFLDTTKLENEQQNTFITSEKLLSDIQDDTVCKEGPYRYKVLLETEHRYIYDVNYWDHELSYLGSGITEELGFPSEAYVRYARDNGFHSESVSDTYLTMYSDRNNQLSSGYWHHYYLIEARYDENPSNNKHFLVIKLTNGHSLVIELNKSISIFQDYPIF
tara:strand:- start:1447 stop:2280 length:834 start_codon:yes stop_codon:yes gene_type:complete